MDPVPSFLVEVGHIADVQELSKSEPTVITGRFVLDMAERPKLAAIVSSPNDIPIIDLSKLMSSDEHVLDIMKLKVACQGWGFFQLIKLNPKFRHCGGIKTTIGPKFYHVLLIWTVQGYGQAFVFSENQKLDWCNMFALGVEPPCIGNPNLWPLKPARLR
ncbi:hypothetical protein ERO13_D09G240766v2 [Gossypium hirsutum]|uniref:Non-haem dioxygenase N-terminal domain-containing protein n=3 Tax=Gossypium TaxID=3633 RepID=A0A5J5QDJ2_GOSBA|nr:hypothetical protein ES319_D09G261300v1 [Gossypium barbadense]KAG4131855.1 hypothetical protein ERO13_D09G240766v2 [Gossypium hirsutum]TYH56028.1 hypothetical protein ES332_D09G279300v1 [Gossypium tomentosum]TYI67034.1 hypothetical protein E1A91_D09G269800v1 [Gossypium mustelinum]